ncbi:hypothetical protein MKZ38_002396 [Zalerion maritima]|uniref:Uncharacterized protein n=1 Tax=Zalerion maritima TaxID=339359 RepID=A0AAD5RP13_9PEZI|nr:hypothetical protein MKZ38_002396 [Zalerion maritima]
MADRRAPNLGESIATLLEALSSSLGRGNMAVNEALGDIAHRLSGRLDSLDLPPLQGDAFDMCVAALGKRLSVCTTSGNPEVLPLIHDSISGLVEMVSRVDWRYEELGSPWVGKLARIADRLQRRKEMALILTIGFVAMASCTFPELCDVTIKPVAQSSSSGDGTSGGAGNGAAGGGGDANVDPFDLSVGDGDSSSNDSDVDMDGPTDDGDHVEEVKTRDEKIIHHWDGLKTNNRELHRFIQTYEWGWRNLFSDFFLEEPRWKPLLGKTEVDMRDLEKVFRFHKSAREAVVGICYEISIRELEPPMMMKPARRDGKADDGDDDCNEAEGRYLMRKREAHESAIFPNLQAMCEQTMVEEWKRHDQHHHHHLRRKQQQQQQQQQEQQQQEQSQSQSPSQQPKEKETEVEEKPSSTTPTFVSKKRKLSDLHHAKTCPKNPDSATANMTRIMGDGIKGDWRNGIEAAGWIRRPEEVANRAMKRIVKLGTRIVKVAEKEEKELERRKSLKNSGKKPRLQIS